MYIKPSLKLFFLSIAIVFPLPLIFLFLVNMLFSCQTMIHCNILWPFILTAILLLFYYLSKLKWEFQHLEFWTWLENHNQPPELICNGCHLYHSINVLFSCMFNNLYFAHVLVFSSLKSWFYWHAFVSMDEAMTTIWSSVYFCCLSFCSIMYRPIFYGQELWNY